MQSIDLFSIATIAFLGSFGHCVGMCGGIVIAYSSTKVQQGWRKKEQSISHLLYSLGRILTYSMPCTEFNATIESSSIIYNILIF